MSGQNILFMQRRSIAGYIPDVVVEERHEDDLRITEHPVEKGAAITDHAYKNPARLDMRVVWTPSLSRVIGSLFSQTISNINDIYDALLKVQASRQVFDVVTKKRSYSNMLMERLTCVTDRDTENVLEIQFSLQQIIVVSTKIVPVKSVNTETLPQSANNITKTGNKQLLTTPDNPYARTGLNYQGVPTNLTLGNG